MTLTKKRIVKNAAMCLLCSDVVESKTTHDLQTCKCGSLSVDGGLSYARHLADNFANVRDMTEFEVDTFPALSDSLK